MGTGGPEITNINADGSYTAYSFGPSGSDNRIQIIANSDFIGSIDNVSVKQLDPNDYWELSSQSEFTSEGARVYSSDGSFQYIQQQGVFETNKTYKLELDIISSNGATLGFAGGIPDIFNTSTLGKRILYVNPTTTYLQIKRSSGVTDITITNISVTEVLGDKPRIDYTDSLTSPSFLLEPQSTNLVEFSEDFSQWTNTGSETIDAANALISPSGLLNATKLQEANSNFGYHRLTKSITASSSTDYSLSFFAKKGTINCVQLLLININNSESSSKVFDLENGVIGETILNNGSLSDSKIEDYGNGWYRCSIVAQLSTPPNTFRINLANAATGNTTNLGMVPVCWQW